MSKNLISSGCHKQWGLFLVFVVALRSIYPELSLLYIYKYGAGIDDKIHSVVWNNNFMWENVLSVRKSSKQAMHILLQKEKLGQEIKSLVGLWVFWWVFFFWLLLLGFFPFFFRNKWRGNPNYIWHRRMFMKDCFPWEGSHSGVGNQNEEEV